MKNPFHQEIGYRTVARWLHQQGFRLKVPRSWPNGQDEEKRKAFVEQLMSYLAHPDIDLWYLDETGIEGDPRPRRRWAKKGEKTRGPYQGTYLRLSATGTVCPRTGEFYALIFSHTDSEIFKIFLDNANMDIHFERRRNILILDNASWHKAKSINWGRFEPVFLLPYSPDLNPIDRLWLIMKGDWFSDFIAKTQEELADRLCQALNWLIDRKEQNQKKLHSDKNLGNRYKRPSSVEIEGCSSKSQCADMPAISTTRFNCISPQLPRTDAKRCALTSLDVSFRSFAWPSAIYFTCSVIPE